MSLKTLLKRKLPATFNASEYHTGLILERLDNIDKRITELEHNQYHELENIKAHCLLQNKNIEQLNSNMQTSTEVLQKLELLTVSEQTNFQKQMSEVKHVLTDLHTTFGKKLQESKDEHAKKLDHLEQIVKQNDLYSIRGCKSDDDFDRKLIPMNQFFGDCGMAVSMHLTSVADKPDKIVYETADITRTATLSLVADEIKARNVSGAVAELGVAKGKFARVINALFPDRPLYLFDTFDGFQEIDIAYEQQCNYSNAKHETYANIDVQKVLGCMPYPEQCIVRQGYFPDTTEGLEKESYCFVSIDCDLYKPIYAGLEYFYPRLEKGGYIFIHDYRSKYYRGVKEALTQFAEKYNISYCVIPDNTGSAIITK